MNEIKLYFHCRKCIEEKLPQNIEAGWTDEGVRVDCKIHKEKIISLDFEVKKVASI